MKRHGFATMSQLPLKMQKSDPFIFACKCVWIYMYASLSRVNTKRGKWLQNLFLNFDIFSLKTFLEHVLKLFEDMIVVIGHPLLLFNL